MVMLNKVGIFFNREFNRNVLTLVAGTGLAQLIPLAVTPFLARIYTPEQFGVLALFVALVSSLSVLATGRYELAIMLPRKDTDASNIAALAIAICLFVSLALFAMACVFNKAISEALGNRSISVWLYFVPLAVFMNGIYLVLNYWTNRKKMYFLMAHRRVLHSGAMSAVQLGLGMAHATAGGLVIGNLSGQAFAAGLMARIVHRHHAHAWREVDGKRMLALAARYKSYPRFLVPAHTLGALSVQLPGIFINMTFGLAASGFFSLAERAVATPLSLVSTSIGDVFRQEISKCYLAGQQCRQIFLSTFRKLAMIATPPFLILLFFSPQLFALVFGAKWRISGEYAQLMCPMFYLRFISNPLSLTAIIAQKNRFEFFWQLGLSIFLVLVAASHHFIPLDAKIYVIAFVIIYGVFDLMNMLASYRFACAGDSRNQGNRAPERSSI